MRLLTSDANGTVSLVRQEDHQPHPYAILSHTWGADAEEVDFQDMTKRSGLSKPGYKKLQFCLQQAASDGLQYFWVDTCCIDKTSSQELSEAINSMYRWYAGSSRCYVYLSDVSTGDMKDGHHSSRTSWLNAFKRSRWFTRGWTLQELLAPKEVEFFSKEGLRLGNKLSLEEHIHDITGIPQKALLGTPLSQFTPAVRMSWAKSRRTRREEDGAYCLLGIFDVTMSLIYSEGRAKAFKRLKKEIEASREDLLPIRQLIPSGRVPSQMLPLDQPELPVDLSTDFNEGYDSNGEYVMVPHDALKSDRHEMRSYASFAVSTLPPKISPGPSRGLQSRDDNYTSSSKSSGMIVGCGENQVSEQQQRQPNLHSMSPIETPSPSFATVALKGFTSTNQCSKPRVSQMTSSESSCWYTGTPSLSSIVQSKYSIPNRLKIQHSSAPHQLSSDSAEEVNSHRRVEEALILGSLNRHVANSSDLYERSLEIFVDQEVSHIPILQFMSRLEEPLKSTLLERLFPIAVEAKNFKSVETFLFLGADPNQRTLGRDDGRYTVLGRAASLGDLETVQVLIKANANVHGDYLNPCERSSPDMDDFEAWSKGGALIQMIRALLPEHWWHPYGRNVRDTEGAEPVSAEKLQIASVLVRHGAVVDHQAMHLAIRTRNYELVHHLASLSTMREPDDWLTVTCIDLLMRSFEDREVLEILSIVQTAKNIRNYTEPNELIEGYGKYDPIRLHSHRSLGAQIIFSGSVLDLAASNGHYKTWEFLGALGLSSSQRTFTYAIIGGSRMIVDALLCKGFRCDMGTRLVWLEGLMNGRVCKQLFDRAMSRGRHIIYFEAYMDPVCAAILSDDAEIFSWIVTRGGMHNIVDDASFYPAVTAAASTGQKTLVEQLLTCKPGVDGTRLSKAILEASVTAHSDIVWLLLQYSPDTLATYDHSHPVLVQSVMQNQSSLAIACLEKINSGSQVAGLARTHLHDMWQNAIEWEQHEVIQALQEIFPDYNRHVEFALLCGNIKLARHFIETDPNTYLGHPFPVQRSEFIDNDYDLDEETRVICCPLSAALFYNSQEIFQLLMSYASDFDCPGIWHCAAKTPEVLCHLSQEFKRKNGNRRTINAIRGLMWSIWSLKETAVKILASICDINFFCLQRDTMRPSDLGKVEQPYSSQSHDDDSAGDPEEQKGSKASSEDVNKLEMDFEGDLDTDRSELDGLETHKRYKVTAFGWAIVHDPTEDSRLIRILLKEGGALERLAADVPRLPLDLAISTGKISKVKLLLDAGAIINREAKRGFSRTPLQYAAERGNYSIVKLLLERGADVNAPPAFSGGATALQLASIQGFMRVAELLLDSGADVNAPAGPVDGRTALEGAAEHGRVLMVQYLIHRGANVRGNGSGQLKRAIQFARDGRHRGLCKYLETLQYPEFTLE